ncbi:expansin B2 [Actinidia rufa]|uniref:Expansin B2 n=1 Tax=Actinidia rufa TaxID=165716 RepID=A0A7J0ED15_9ERIC|nr:expansin B2 [Actinidia rufa]
MAISHQLFLSHIFILSCLLAFCCFFEPALCFKPRHFNLSTRAIHWSPAGATWYGSPNGAGSSGGACGYGESVSKPPFSSMIAATGPSLYQSGKECGACYQVKCTAHPGVFGEASAGGHNRFLPGRVACNYPGKTIAFRVDLGSNPNYIAVVVEFEDGDGDLARVDLKEASSKTNKQWRAMQRSWGAVWKLDAGSQLKPPFSIRLTSEYSGQTLVARNVIPNGWRPGATYRSLVNYL